MEHLLGKFFMSMRHKAKHIIPSMLRKNNAVNLDASKLQKKEKLIIKINKRLAYSQDEAELLIANWEKKNIYRL